MEKKKPSERILEMANDIAVKQSGNFAMFIPAAIVQFLDEEYKKSHDN